MARFAERRLEPLPLPATREEWLAQCETLRRQVREIVGIDALVPASWDLGVRCTGVLRRAGYRIEKLTYESYPGYAVPALLYVPESLCGRAPGVVSLAGHAYATGKATDYLQQRNANLALRGCVVLVYDYVDCGERNTGPDPGHDQPYGGGNDHGISSFSFSRRTPTALDVLDGMRALEVLLTRPEVDPQRLGFTGESGAGNSTYWMAALDPRVRLAVPVSSVTTFDYWIRHDRNWDWHQRPPGIRRVADIGTLLALHAPAPLLVVSSARRTDDTEFPWEEAEKSVAWARRVYGLLGAEEAIAHVESVTGHGYQEDKRRHLYRWVERWLDPPSPQGDAELPVRVEAFAELRCGLPKNSATLRSIYAEWLAPLPRTPRTPPPSLHGELRAFLRARLGLPEPLPAVAAARAGAEDKDGWRAESWLFQPEPDIRLSGVLIGAAQADGTVVLIPGRDEEAMARALAAGHRVFAFDPRGTGEMADSGVARNWAWFAGRPLTGLWALDLVQAARLCRERLGASAVVVDARNRFGWAALLAGAAMEDLLESGAIALPWTTLRERIHAEGDGALAEVFGLAERLDVPQLRVLWPGAKVSVARSG